MVGYATPGVKDKTIELTKVHLDLHQFTEKKGFRKNIAHVHVSNKIAEATNGHLLVMVETGGNAELDVLIKSEFMKVIAKLSNGKANAMPPEKIVGLNFNEDNKCMAKNCSGQSSVFTYRNNDKDDLEFPETDKIIPETNDDWRMVHLDARYLEQLCKFIRQYGKGEMMQLFLGPSPASPILMKGEARDTGQAITMVLMPTRG